MANAPQLTVGLGFDLDEASANKVVKGMERLGEYLEKSSEENARKVKNNWQDTFSDMVKGFVAVEVAGRAWGFAKDLIMLEERFKNMQMPLKNLTEQTGDFAGSMFFLKGLANDLGQDIFTLSDAYKGVYASGKQAGMSTESLNGIFQAVVRSGSALKLSNDKIELSMKAIEQMMNKGVIGSEELRQQLGDHLPGAYAIMAKAAKDAGLSVTGSTQELGKLLEEGKLASNVVLPFFAKRMEEAFGKNAEANITTISGSANRLRNELTYLVTALDDSVITSFWAKFQNGLADVFKYMTYISKTGTWIDFIRFFTGGANMVNVAQMVGSEGRVKQFAELDRSKQMPILLKKNADLRAAEKMFNENSRAGIKGDKSAILRQQLEYKNFASALKAIDKGIGGTPKGGGGGKGSDKARLLAIDLEELAQKSKDAAEQLANVNQRIAEFEFSKARRNTPMGAATTLDNTSVRDKEKKSFLNDLIDVSGVDFGASEDALRDKFEKLKNKIKPIVNKTFSGFPFSEETLNKIGINVSDGFNKIEKDLVENFSNLILDFKKFLKSFNIEETGNIISEKLALWSKKLSKAFSTSTEEAFSLMSQTMKIAGNLVADTMYLAFESLFDPDIKFSFKTALGNFLFEFGKLIVGIGTKMLAAGILLTLDPITASSGAKKIALGTGLIALGSAASAKGSVMSRNETPSPSQSPSYNSTFTAPTQSAGVPKVEFVIQGTTLKGVLNNVDYSY